MRTSQSLIQEIKQIFSGPGNASKLTDEFERVTDLSSVEICVNKLQIKNIVQNSQEARFFKFIEMSAPRYAATDNPNSARQLLSLGFREIPRANVLKGNY